MIMIFIGIRNISLINKRNQEKHMLCQFILSFF